MNLFPDEFDRAPRFTISDVALLIIAVVVTIGWGVFLWAVLPWAGRWS
jgi:hypothetical protein